MSHRCLILTLFLLSFATAALAETVSEPLNDVETIVVYGRRPSSRDLTQVTDAVTVISRVEIEESQAVVLVDVLRERAGVTVRSTGGPGTSTTVSLRGSESNQVQVVIDGVRVGSATTGAFNWANLTAQDIERIEILRGPQSTLYGGSAIGGVILIYTRDGGGPLSVGAYGGLGNEEQRQVGGRVSGEWQGVRYFVSAEHSSIDGVSAFLPDPVPTPSPEVDPYRNTTVSGRVTLPVGEGEFVLFGRFTDAHAELDSATSDNPSFDQDTQQYSYGGTLSHPFNQYWVSKLHYGEFGSKLKGRDPLLSFNNFDVETVSRLVTSTNEITWQNFTALAGIDFEFERGKNPSGSIDENSKQTGLFLQGSYDRELLGLTAGVRQEWNSLTRSETTFQLGGRLTPLEGIDVLINYGTAFRPPTLNELFFQDAFSQGNPDLNPESSVGGDLGLRVARRFGDDWLLRSEVWGFYQVYDDLIEFRSGPDFIFRPVNISKVRSRGVETLLRVRWKAAWISAEYTYLRVRDDEGFALRRRPDHAGRLALGGTWWGLSGELAVRFVGESFSRSRERDRVDGYETVDLNLGYVITDNFQVRGHVHNLADRDYREVFNRGTLGRTYMLTVEARY